MSSNRFNRGKQISTGNPYPKFPQFAATKPPSSTNPRPGTSKQVPGHNKATIPTKKKKQTQIWVKKGSRRNWLELPRDVTLTIFLKLGVIDILFNAQSVCSSWRDIARDPLLYRRVDMSNPWDHFEFDPSNFDPLIAMAVEAVDRSRGGLVELLIDCFADGRVLRRVLREKCELKYIRLAACYHLNDYELAKFVKRMPSLEEFELCRTSFSPIRTIKAAGECCKQLRSFRLNHVGTRVPRVMIKEEEVNDEALAISDSLSGVRSLHLFGNLMTNKGLAAILEKCPRLEYLDLRQCFNVDVEGDMLRKCQRIKRLRLPFDSTEDYEYGTSINYMDSDDDIEPQYAYDDFTDPFNDLHLYDDDDDDYNIFLGNDGGDGPSLVDLLFMDALLGIDDDDDDLPDFGF